VKSCRQGQTSLSVPPAAPSIPASVRPDANTPLVKHLGAMSPLPHRRGVARSLMTRGPAGTLLTADRLQGAPMGSSKAEHTILVSETYGSASTGSSVNCGVLGLRCRWRNLSCRRSAGCVLCGRASNDLCVARPDTPYCAPPGQPLAALHRRGRALRLSGNPRSVGSQQVVPSYSHE
jgi:hypothetical protein